MMFTIEYLWSIAAVTQALIVTFQAGSKLLLPLSSKEQHHQQQHDIANSRSGILSLPQLTTTSIMLNNNITTGSDHSNTNLPDSNIFMPSQNDSDDSMEKEDILRAFQCAIQMGLQCGNDHVDDNHDNKTIITKHYRRHSGTDKVEPYRLSLTPFIRTRTAPTTNSSKDSEVGCDSIATTEPNITQSTNETDTTSTGNTGTLKNLVTNTSTSQLRRSNNDYNEYYEFFVPLREQVQSVTTMTFDTASGNRSDTTTSNFDNDVDKVVTVTTTTSARIRVYAPQTFRKLRSYYHDDYSSNVTDSNHEDRRIELSEENFQRSILLPSLDEYVFFQTNSKGSQRTKNIFIYTNISVPFNQRIHEWQNNRNFKHCNNNRKGKFANTPKQQQQYMIKSIKRDEFHTLLDIILPQYVPYMEQNGPTSLLNRIYGIYDITIYTTTSRKNGKNIENKKRYYLIVLNTIFDPSLTTATTTRENANVRKMFQAYDIKGSTVGRTSKATSNDVNESNNQPSQRSSVTYKDMDLIMECSMDSNLTMPSSPLQDNTTDILSKEDASFAGKYRLFNIGSTRKPTFLQQLRNDVQFLSSCSVIDYSLLVGIETELRSNIDRQQTRSNRWRFWGFKSLKSSDISHAIQDRGVSPLSFHLGIRNGRPAMYYFGIIDFLQPYNYKKEIEYRVKSLLYEKNTFSCIPPSLYAERFTSFIDQYVV